MSAPARRHRVAQPTPTGPRIRAEAHFVAADREDRIAPEVVMKAVVVYESHWGNTEAIARTKPSFISLSRELRRSLFAASRCWRLFVS